MTETAFLTREDSAAVEMDMSSDSFGLEAAGCRRRGYLFVFSHPDGFHQSVHDCKNGPANFPLFDTIDVRDIDEAQFAESTLG